MAGAGKKTFTAGEILTASDTNTYLMEQTVMYFAGTAARASAIPTPSTGMTTYIGVTGTATIPQIETYTGSAWQTPYGATLVANVSFTSAVTVTMDNIFTSAYRSYKVVFGVTNKTTTSDINLQLRRSGSTLAGASAYRLQSIRTYGATVDSFPNSIGTNLIRPPAAVGGGQQLYYDIDVYDPTVTTDTHLKSQWFAYDGANFVQALTQSLYFESGAGNCDGLIFTNVSGSATGFAKVYGMRNS